MIDEDLNVLQEYKDQQKVYDGHRYDDCPNFVKGHVPELYIENERIKIRYLPCPCKLNMMRNDLIHNLLHLTICKEIHFMQKLKDIYMNNRERLDVAMAADQICTAITNDEKVKGLYLYGPWYRKIIHIGCYCKST